MVIVLLGAPGAGKGTQAPILASRLGVPILASGDLLRAVVRSGSELGRELDTVMRSGALVSDATTVRIFLDRLAAPDAANGAILDGFPRTAAQAKALDVALADQGARVDAAILIDVPAADLVERMTGRLICRLDSTHVYNSLTKPPLRDRVCDIDGSELLQRADDAPDTVRARMAKQLVPLAEVVAHYRDAGILRIVDGRRSIDAVTDEVMAAL
ncbi:MAG TPA: nucleoside monophosphate kinase [Candidatus Limnocylindrales bacterium]|jgi:adenylate kinase